ncbi:hypothetical protein K438DRAFT_2012887 [Mycena galopus ATCC 62051]|nr:hypothetical protein K438DRAFT_2012887 [Mycena galopus ATCC 62051]
MSISSLPYDVVDEILTGMSYEEIKTLKAASLVCRSWSESVQKRIFAELRMGCYPNAHPHSRSRHRRHIDHVCDVLSTDVNRASLVKRFVLEPSAVRLGLSGLEIEDDEREQFDREEEDGVSTHDYAMPFIQQFEGQIVTILESLDRLQHLQIDFQVYGVSWGSIKGSLPRFIPALRRTLSLLPTLSSFSMRSGGFDTVDDMAEIFLDGCHIQHLEICSMWFPWSSKEAYTRQPFLGCRVKLRSLALGSLCNEGNVSCDIQGTFVDWLGSEASAFDLGHLLELNESEPDVRPMDQHRLVSLLKQTSASLAHYTGRLPIEPLEQHFPGALLSLHIRENEYYYPSNTPDHFINVIPSLIAFLAHPASRKLETLTVEAGRRRSHLHHDSFPFQGLPIWIDLDAAICFSPYADKLREVKIMKRTCDRPECMCQQPIQDQITDTWYFVDADPAGRFSRCIERGIRVLSGMMCQTCIREQQKLD